MVFVILWTYEGIIGHTKSENIIQIISKLSLQLGRAKGGNKNFLLHPY
jgi:hypothetical protein